MRSQTEGRSIGLGGKQRPTLALLTPPSDLLKTSDRRTQKPTDLSPPASNYHRHHYAHDLPVHTRFAPANSTPAEQIALGIPAAKQRTRELRPYQKRSEATGPPSLLRPALPVQQPLLALLLTNVGTGLPLSARSGRLSRQAPLATRCGARERRSATSAAPSPGHSSGGTAEQRGQRTTLRKRGERSAAANAEANAVRDGSVAEAKEGEERQASPGFIGAKRSTGSIPHGQKLKAGLPLPAKERRRPTEQRRRRRRASVGPLDSGLAK